MPETPAPEHKQGLDEVLLAMDVVDTLRHRDRMVLRELDQEGREAELIERLREIYTAQGIEVPDAILRDGVKALQENRFEYSPPKPSFSVRLAKLYVSRGKWLKHLLAGMAALAAAVLGYQYGVVKPAKAKAEAVRVEFAETLPRQLAEARDAVQTAALDVEADRLAETYYQDGLAATQSQNREQSMVALRNLEILQRDIAKEYEIRVIYGPDVDLSGVFRIPENDPTGRNYYLIVEAVDAAGRRVEVPVISEEDQQRRRTTRWGQRVSKAVFDRVAADKGDDQIIQDAVIGVKPSGYYVPVYSVETPGGALLEW